MNKGMALQGIETLIQEGNNVLNTKYNSDLAGTYVDSAMYNSYLFHALLLLYFDDIRAEEWTSSYAGKSARMDFLLKNEGVVIEVKKTRLGLTDKELGDQLIIDVDRYKVHPDCKRLVCFVYDAEGRIGNPNGLMADLNNQHEGFATVIIKPDM